MPLIRKNSPAIAGLASGSLEAALRNSAPEERWAAARGLSAPTDVAILGAALSDEPDARVREAILTSLIKIGTPQAAKAIEPHIGSDDAGLRTAALDALRAMPIATNSSLPALLANPDPDVRLLAAELVRAAPEEDRIRLLCGLLEHEAEPNVCAAAIEVLAEAPGPDARPALIRCAERFASEPFLAFSIKVVLERIESESGGSLG